MGSGGMYCLAYMYSSASGGVSCLAYMYRTPQPVGGGLPGLRVLLSQWV